MGSMYNLLTDVEYLAGSLKLSVCFDLQGTRNDQRGRREVMISEFETTRGLLAHMIEMRA
jgi:hypothetical protein